MDSFIQRNSVLLSTALVACHASFQAKGFRQAKLNFYVELFHSWIYRGREQDALALQTTQITRFLEQLVKDGFILRVQGGKRSPYALSRMGLLEMLSRITEPRPDQLHQEFLFSYYFIRVYRDRLITLVRAKNALFPPAMQIELEALLDHATMLRNKIERQKIRLKKIFASINSAKASSQLAQNLLGRRTPLPEVIQELQGKYPYEFHALKSLQELISEIPVEARSFELSEGNTLRIALLWEPIYKMEEQFLHQLLALQKGE